MRNLQSHEKQPLVRYKLFHGWFPKAGWEFSALIREQLIYDHRLERKKLIRETATMKLKISFGLFCFYFHSKCSMNSDPTELQREKYSPKCWHFIGFYPVTISQMRDENHHSPCKQILKFTPYYMSAGPLCRQLTLPHILPSGRHFKAGLGWGMIAMWWAW